MQTFVVELGRRREARLLHFRQRAFLEAFSPPWHNPYTKMSTSKGNKAKDKTESRGEKLQRLEEERAAVISAFGLGRKSDLRTKPPTPEKHVPARNLRSRDTSPAIPEPEEPPPKKNQKKQNPKAVTKKETQKLQKEAKVKADKAKAAALAKLKEADVQSDGDESESLLDGKLYAKPEEENEPEGDPVEEPHPKSEEENPEVEPNSPSSAEESDDDPREPPYKPSRDELDSDDDDDDPKDDPKSKEENEPEGDPVDEPHPKSEEEPHTKSLATKHAKRELERNPPPKPKRHKPTAANPRKKPKPPPQSTAEGKEPPADTTVVTTGEKATLLAHVRDAFKDMGPHLPPRMPFIYWDPDVTFSCAAKLISRSPVLERMAQNYDCANDLAKKHGQIVRTVANNERSTQIRVMKAMWLNNDSPLSFTAYTETTPPVVSLTKEFALLFPEGVDQFLSILESPSMYTNPEVYEYLCLGLESGNFKGTEPKPITTISELLTPSHEAHFRAELWWAMPSPAFRHSIGRIHGKKRIAKWREFLPHVFNDRKDHEQKAHDLRVKKYEAAGGRIEKDKDMAGTADNVDERFW